MRPSLSVVREICTYLGVVARLIVTDKASDAETGRLE